MYKQDTSTGQSNFFELVKNIDYITHSNKMTDTMRLLVF